MGLFNKLGRQVEEFKQEALAAAEQTATYECEACETRLHAEYEECPDCGAEAVIPRPDTE